MPNVLKKHNAYTRNKKQRGFRRVVNGKLVTYAPYVIVAVISHNLASLSKIENYYHPTVTGTPVTSFRFNINKTDAHSGMRFNPADLTVGETYTFSYKFQKVSGTLLKVGGHIGAFTPVKWLFDGVEQTTAYSTAISVSDDTEVHEVVFTGVYNKAGGDINLYFQPNRGSADPVSVDIWDVQLELGDTATPWMPAEEDAGVI